MQEDARSWTAGTIRCFVMLKTELRVCSINWTIAWVYGGVQPARARCFRPRCHGHAMKPRLASAAFSSSILNRFFQFHQLTLIRWLELPFTEMLKMFVVLSHCKVSGQLYMSEETASKKWQVLIVLRTDRIWTLDMWCCSVQKFLWVMQNNLDAGVSDSGVYVVRHVNRFGPKQLKMHCKW